MESWEACEGEKRVTSIRKSRRGRGTIEYNVTSESALEGEVGAWR